MPIEQAGLPLTDGGQKQGYKDEETLHRLYHDEEMDLSEIAEKFDTTSSTISYWMNKMEIDTTHTSHDNEESVEGRGGFSGDAKGKCIYFMACGNKVPGGNNLCCDKCLALARERSRDGKNCPLDGVGKGDLLDHMEMLHQNTAT